MRLLNLIVIAALVAAAAWVYKIKFDAAVQAEKVERIRAEIRKERDQTAALRAEWAKLDNPARIQRLSERYLGMKPMATSQFDALDHLPERVVPTAPPAMEDPIAKMIDADEITGNISSGR
jgi:cell division protein FtsL